MARLVLGTRGSALALWQARHVVEALRRADPGLEVELRVIRTTGDRILDGSLAALGGKGLFLKEIEEALLRGEIDCAVHSLKDVPGQMAEGCELAAVLERGDPRDALCLGAEALEVAGAGGVAPGAGATATAWLRRLPRGARIGTSSLRRRLQILALRTDLEVVPLRGNVDTRLRKLDAGEVEGLVLAAAGLCRLGLDHRAAGLFEPEEMVPAVGQGAVAVEVRAGDAALRGRLAAALDHRPSRLATAAERAYLRTLGGSCRVPVGAYGTVDGGAARLRLAAVLGGADGHLIRDRAEGPAADAEAIGARLAEAMLAAGGRELLGQLSGGMAERARR